MSCPITNEKTAETGMRSSLVDAEDGIDWNEPFHDLCVSEHDQRVRDEGYVVLGQSIISSDILDFLLCTALFLLFCLAQFTVLRKEQLLPMFQETKVWRKVVLSTSLLLAASIALGRLLGDLRIGTVRFAFSAQLLYLVHLLLSEYNRQHMHRWLAPTVSVLVVYSIAVFASPVLTAYLEKHYREASVAHTISLARHQISLLGEVAGRNLQAARPSELGEIFRNAFRRLNHHPNTGSDLTFFDFNHIDSQLAAFLLFVPSTEHIISKQRFLQTAGEICTEWSSVCRSLSRSTAVFSVLTGLLDFCAIGLAAMFGMAAFGFSILHLIGAALFVYGIVNSFLGVAITQWKLGVYFVLGRHPYDIGDWVVVNGCGKGSMQVIDYSLTTSLFRKAEGQALSVLHRDIAFSKIINTSRPKVRRVVLTLSPDDSQGIPVIEIVRDILTKQSNDYFVDELRIVSEGKGRLDEKTKILLTYRAGLNARQRTRGLVKFCSLLRETALEAKVED